MCKRRCRTCSDDAVKSQGRLGSHEPICIYVSVSVTRVCKKRSRLTVYQLHNTVSYALDVSLYITYSHLRSPLTSKQYHKNSISQFNARYFLLFLAHIQASSIVSLWG